MIAVTASEHSPYATHAPRQPIAMPAVMEKLPSASPIYLRERERVCG